MDSVTPTSRRGRPPLDNNCPLQKDKIRKHLDHMRGLNFKWTDIASQLGVTTQWLRNWRKSNAYSDPIVKSDISDDELDMTVGPLQHLHFNRGEIFMEALLKDMGVIVTRQRLRDSIKRVDPEGRERRRMQRVQRVEYNVTGPHQLWHMDGTHKLRTWNLSIQGCIDGGTRLVTLLRCNDSNTAEVNLHNFKIACEEFMVPSRLRTDKGGENVKVADFMLRMRGLGRGSILAGKSIRNQRIERLWGDVNKDVVDHYKLIFVHLETHYYANFDLLDNLIVLHHLFLPRINESLDRFKSMWNMHKISSENNRTPSQLEILRADERAPPPGEEILEEDANFFDDEDEDEDTPRVIINPLERILTPAQQREFDYHNPPISLREIDLDDMGERFLMTLTWLDRCREDF